MRAMVALGRATVRPTSTQVAVAVRPAALSDALLNSSMAAVLSIDSRSSGWRVAPFGDSQESQIRTQFLTVTEMGPLRTLCPAASYKTLRRS
jgi:hypothetical protein